MASLEDRFLRFLYWAFMKCLIKRYITKGLIVVLICNIFTTSGTLMMNELQEQNGFVKLRINDVEIVNTTFTILHIINIKQLNKAIDEIEDEFDRIEIKKTELDVLELNTLRAKVRSIMPKRIKRGLVNAVGTVQKWLFGTMDDNDRQDILDHMKLINENNHNAIENLNRQIFINTNFNNSINVLKNAIEADKKYLAKYINQKNIVLKNLIQTVFHQKLILKIRYLESKINQIQDNVAASKYNNINPSILTVDELDKFDVDIYKLKLTKIGLLKYDKNCLIIAIKIPKTYILTELNAIIPLPNKDYFEINFPTENVVNINSKMLKYQPGKMLNELKVSKHCLFRNNCKLIYNNVTGIEILNDATIVIKNPQNKTLYENCDERNSIVLFKNTFISFANCEIKFDEAIFYNAKTSFVNQFSYPEDPLNISFTKLIPPDSFELDFIDNLKKITEAKEINVHHYINYALIIVLLVIIVLIFLFFKLKFIKLNLKSMIEKPVQRNKYNNSMDSIEQTIDANSCNDV